MYEYQSVDCAFTSPVSMESCELVICCMQFGMFVLNVVLLGDATSCGIIHRLETAMCLLVLNSDHL